MPAGATLVHREAVIERQFNLSFNLFIHSFCLHARRCGRRAGRLHASKDRPRPSAVLGCLSANLVEATRISAVAGIPDVHDMHCEMHVHHDCHNDAHVLLVLAAIEFYTNVNPD